MKRRPPVGRSLRSFRRCSFLFTIKYSSRLKQRNMRKCLRKISQLPLFAWIVLLGQKSEIVSQIEQALEKFASFFVSAEEMPAGNKPERARKKNTFPCR